jgi:hypothetical protein
LDIVQDAMMRLAEKYGDRPAPSGRCCSSVFCKMPYATAIGDQGAVAVDNLVFIAFSRTTMRMMIRLKLFGGK